MSTAAPAPRPRLGFNVNDFTYWSLFPPFSDLALGMGPFSAVAPAGAPRPALTPRPDGYPAALPQGVYAQAVVPTGDRATAPTGVYTLTYQGTGTVTAAGAAKVLTSDPGVLTLQVPAIPDRWNPAGRGADPVYVQVRATDPNDPVHAVSVYRPGVDPRTAPRFNPDYLAAYRGAASVRYVDWVGAIGSTAADWSDRPGAGGGSYFHADTPYETCIDFSNAIGADCFIPVPVPASDDYVARLCTLARDRLDPSLYLRLELGCECWNSQFLEWGQCSRAGLAAGLSTDPVEAWRAYYARRTAQVAAVARPILGSRLRMVVSSQHANPWLANRLLTGYGPLGVDELATAPYLAMFCGPADNPHTGVPAASTVEAWGPDRVNAWVDRNVLPAVVTSMRAHAALAQRLDLDYITYEGGQSCGATAAEVSDQNLTAALAAANRAESMGAVMSQYLGAWAGAGGDLFHHLAGFGEPWNGYGYWTLTERPSEVLPKQRAVLYWGQGCGQPFDVPAGPAAAQARPGPGPGPGPAPDPAHLADTPAARRLARHAAAFGGAAGGDVRF